MADANGRISVSEETLRAALSDMKLDIVREIQGVKDQLPDEDRVRVIAREEIKNNISSTWSVRASVATCFIVLIATATFLLTTLPHRAGATVKQPSKVVNTIGGHQSVPGSTGQGR